MNRTLRSFRTSDMHRQAGVSLVIALVFLVVLTLLGLGMFFSTKSEEAMARNFRDREIALHAAEAALREAEVLITGSYDTAAATLPSPLPVSLSSNNCNINTPTGFTCVPQDVNALNLFAIGSPSAKVGDLGAARTSQVPGLAIQPRYLIVWQKLSEVCGLPADSVAPSCFQIIAQAQGRLPNTRVNLVELFIN